MLEAEAFSWSDQNYRVCEQITEEMMELKSRKCQLEKQKWVFENSAQECACVTLIRGLLLQNYSKTDCEAKKLSETRGYAPL